MAWVKRNLYFLIGCSVAVGLMGWTGWNLWGQWQRIYAEPDGLKSKLEAEYGKLQNLNSQKPHPGFANGRPDNIQIATDGRKELQVYVGKATNYFQRIVPIPAENLSDRSFSAALSRLIDQMQHEATNASVILPANYGFSFAAERDKVSFVRSGLAPLSVQLGEVKAICDILFQAKINWLDNLRREPSSPDDASGQQTDYLAQKSVTNDLAIITPYEITFRSFSSELASVLSGFASSPYGFVVKVVNVKSASSAGESGFGPGGGGPPPPIGVQIQPPPTAPQPPPASSDAYMANRYGTGPDRGGGGTPGGIPYRGLGTPGSRNPYSAPNRGGPVPGVAPVPGTQTPAARSGPLQIALDEKLLEITINLDVVKLLSNQPKQPKPGGGSGAPGGQPPVARVPSGTPPPQ